MAALVLKTRRTFVIGSENEGVCEAMGINVWNRLELIEICVISDGVDPHISCTSSFYTSSQSPECETSRTNVR